MTNMKTRLLVLFLFVGWPLAVRAQYQTRGVGVYPGDPAEDYSPGFKIDSIRYRNLALHRPAYQSGSYDYNLTAQLITDGFTSDNIHGPITPGWIVTTASTGGVLPRNEREWVLDRHPMSRNTLEGPNVWLQVELAGNSQIPLLDSIIVSGTILTDSLLAKPWVVSVRGSSDGTNWKLLGRTGGATLPGDTLTGFLRRFSPPNLRAFSLPFRLDSTDLYRFYRINANSPNALRWSISEFGMYHMGLRAEVGGPYRFTSAWKSAGAGVEWVSVDLGAECTIYALDLNWIRHPSEGSVQVSSDGAVWKKIASLSESPGSLEVLKLAVAAQGRFVRILMKKPASADGYILSELQVFGTGGPVPVPHAPAKVRKDGRMDLAGGDWRIQRESAVSASGESIASARFDPADWLVATVPGTVLVSYLNAGAIPDPNFGDNQLAISESFFYSDFWYRDEFMAPSVEKGRRMRLNFDGINWKADVYLNGHALGAIEGAFCRRAFDITDILVPGKKNFLAVKIHRNSNPGFATEQTRYSPDANGGELGADNPTFHASVGWDWIPTIRGRNTGIWNNVYISESGPVTIEDPFVSATIPLPDTTRADLRLTVTLHNSASSDVAGTVRGSFGSFPFEEQVRLSASETKTILIDPSTHPSLRLKKPRLWWPNGYGAQNLYSVNLAFVTSGGRTSDSYSFKSGIRQMSYSEEGGALRIWVNGRRFIARGGNWGFPESMLRYRSREYDIAVRYHKEMNFTMIRNWVGQTPDDAFFEACDRHGIMVWQDFWLANPLDGPDPDDTGLFMRNATDFVGRIRNHPCLALYVGRNEGNPPAAIDTALRALVRSAHPDLHYISNSAFGVVGGGGPYRRMPVKFYFEKRSTEKLHSEMGMPAVVSYESLRHMLPDSALWPQSALWGMHDFTLEGAQSGNSFNQAVEENFGKVDSLRLWLSCAQWINYQGYRAMFEAQSRNRMGLLLWMSHPAWPSLVWQTYDYDFEPTAAYFGSKKACEPLHIQWNPLSDSIEVVNYSVSGRLRLRAEMEILNAGGNVLLRKEAGVVCPEDGTRGCFAVGPPADSTALSLVRLTLRRDGKAISENSYWRGLEEIGGGESRNVNRDVSRNVSRGGNRRVLALHLDSDAKLSQTGGVWRLTSTVVNNSGHPALAAALRVVCERSGKRILPAFYSDNYFPLMPGEHRTVTVEVFLRDSGGETPVLEAEGLGVD